MVFETICYIKNNEYIAKPLRTYLLLTNIINEIKISYFDILDFIEYSKTLILNINLNRKIVIKSDNIKNLFKNILSCINKLDYDLDISNLLIDEKKCNCSICLDENNNDFIIKVDCCNNLFHLKCYTTYIKSRFDYSCPICRSNKLIIKNKIEKEYCIKI